MSERINQMIRQFADQPSLEECPVHDLVNLSNRYPFAANFHLLRLQKYGAGASRTQIHTVALHTYNPLLLQQWLHPDSFTTEFDMPATPVVQQPEVAPEPLPVEEPVEIKPPVTEPAPPDPIPVVPEQITESNITEIQDAVESSSDSAVVTEEKEPVPANDSITFEPFHTVDYFASQGIKLSKSELPNDQLGRQLKSFTEWLKTMKKLPTTAITHNTDGAGEQKVQILAAHSLDNLDVATEAMAEVWIKQGVRDKAIAIYQKLSLSNPAKSAYFAAKIESLKNESR